MTKKEITGNRQHDLWFSGWIREKLPDSFTGYRCCDIDFILWNKNKRFLMIIELKSYKKYLAPDQALILNLFKKQFKKGMDDGWIYKGFHLIQFENTNFDNGWCKLNKNEISEDELINFLSFKK